MLLFSVDIAVFLNWIVAVLVFALSLPLRLTKIPLHWQTLVWTVFRRQLKAVADIFQYCVTLIFLISCLLPAFSTLLQCGDLLAHLSMFISPLSWAVAFLATETISLQPSPDLKQWHAPCTFKLLDVCIMEPPSTIINNQSWEIIKML